MFVRFFAIGAAALLAGTASADLFMLNEDLRLLTRPDSDNGPLTTGTGVTVLTFASGFGFRGNFEFDLAEEIALSGSTVQSANWSGVLDPSGTISSTLISLLAYQGSLESEDTSTLHDVTDTEGGVVVGTLTVEGSENVQFSVDVTSAIQAILDGGGDIFGGQVQSEANSQQLFVTGATTLTIELVPTPGAATLAGIAGMAAFRRRRV
ncbi:MAG: hypothetical protein AAGB34_02975 [Planctomycetota bacterium]